MNLPERLFQTHVRKIDQTRQKNPNTPTAIHVSSDCFLLSIVNVKDALHLQFIGPFIKANFGQNKTMNIVN